MAGQRLDLRKATELLRSGGREFRPQPQEFDCKNDWVEGRQVRLMKMKIEGRRE